MSRSATVLRVFTFSSAAPTTFADQSELDTFLVDNSISSSQWLQIVQALGYANQAAVDTAVAAGDLTGEIILTELENL